MAQAPKMEYGRRGRVVTDDRAGSRLGDRLRVARRHAAKRLGMRAIRRLRHFMGRQSVVGNPRIFDVETFPFLDDLRAHWREIRRELDGLLETRDRLPPLHMISPDATRIADDDWKTFLFYGFGTRSERNCALCPETTRLLEGVPGLQNAWFSILGPGVRVPRHRGISKGLIRCHLGLIVPEKAENCRMSLADETFSWREGELVVFDDTRPHAVWNATDQQRVVLLFDFVRPMRPLGRLLGSLFLAGIRRHGYYVDAFERQSRWEEAYHAEP